MYSKLIKNDIKKSKLITAMITIFIVIAATLTSLAATLTVNLFTAIESMMVTSKTSHLFQMHAGDIDMGRLKHFVETHSEIEDYQVLPFLNIEGADIVIGENSLAGSIQDNGFSVQSERFDYLLDLDGKIITPKEGEVYVPIYYMREGQIKIGDQIDVHGVPFKAAGFLRDAQMNPSMISSKRFLIHARDYEKIKRYGKLERLIEFRLTDPAAVSKIETDYLDAGMEANGPPTITYSLTKLANAMSDGIMIAILILISLLVILINFLCIRFTLVAKVEEDYREIGVLKAIGLRVANIKKLYLAKYGVLAGIACVIGFIISFFAKELFMENIRRYMGSGPKPGLSVFFGIVGAALIFVIILLYVNGILQRFKKISAAQAIRFGAPQDRGRASRGFQLQKSRVLPVNALMGIKDILSRKKLYVTMLLVLIISVFLLLVPQNIYHTISQRGFMTYMGIGECNMRIDIQQATNIKSKIEEISDVLAKDQEIVDHTVLISYMFDLHLDDGTIGKLKVEIGDHSRFPISYSKGKAPQSEEEISISSLIADDIYKDVGDTIRITVDGKEKELKISGIYSDITNGGRTAKAVFDTDDAQVIWSIIPIRVREGVQEKQKLETYRSMFPYAKVSNIDDYLDQIFGSTVRAAQKVSVVSVIAAALFASLITALFMKMLITKDRFSIAVLKSIGFKDQSVKRQYMVRAAIILALGIILGVICANTLGEQVSLGLISQFGASSFKFSVNPLFAYLLSPALITICVCFATVIGISGITRLKVSEYIKE